MYGSPYIFECFRFSVCFGLSYAALVCSVWCVCGVVGVGCGVWWGVVCGGVWGVVVS
jgi:hypothetical protein